MEEYIHNLRIVMGTLGHRVLEPIKMLPIQNELGRTPRLSSYVFSFSIRGVTATGQQTDDRFVIFEGSALSGTTSKSIPTKVLSIRNKWIEDRVLVREGDNFRLMKDVVLSSSSYAAAAVAGTSRSGPLSWKDDQGRHSSTLRKPYYLKARFAGM